MRPAILSLALVGTLAVAPAARAGCWVCLSLENASVESSLSGPNAGVGPEEKAAANPAARLLQERQADRLAEGPAAPGFRLTPATLARLEKVDALAAAILNGLAREEDRLQSGSFDGVASVGAPGKGFRSLRFQARVEATASGASFRIELLDWEKVSALEGELTRTTGGNRLQVEDLKGFPTVSRW